MKHYEIAILLGYPEISGGTNVILEHALGLTRLGHSVSIVTEQPFDPQRLSWKPAAQELPLLCHADCRERMFDVSVATWWRSVFDLPHVPAHRYTYFCQSIESRFFSEQEPDMKALVDFTYRQPLPVVTEASWIAQYLREYYGRETALVRNGIDKSIFRPDGERLAPRPRAGLRGLVEGPLGVSFKRVEFTIRLCQQAGIEDIWLLTSTDCSSYPGVSRVLSRVPMQEVGAVYRSCDVLVKLSTVEGMFGPPLEMMHCGGTAITSDVTGHEEYMRHGQNGIVIRRGEEAEVIDYLRALHRDRAFLNLLKDGARTTAAEWPDWSHATREMEQFVCELCQREPTHKSVQHDMLTQLRAALRLAGPLREAVAPDHSGRELLGMAWAKLRAKVARKLGPRPTAANGAPLVPATPARTVPDVPRARQPAPQTHYRICFVGDERRFAAHAPLVAERATTVFVNCRGALGAKELSQIIAFGPDHTVVFEPERYESARLDAVPGFVIGYSTAPASAATLAALRARFPLSASNARVALHPHVEVVTILREAGIGAAGAFLLPSDWQTLGALVDFATWQKREIDLLYVGAATATNQELLAALREFPGFLHLSEPATDQALCGVLSRTKLALHLPASEDAYFDAAKVIRDLMCGCLVVGHALAADYGLMPGEHYLFFEKPAQLAALVRQQLTLPDELDVIRCRGQQRARLFDAGRDYVAMIERYCCASRLCGATATAPAALEAATTNPPRQ